MLYKVMFVLKLFFGDGLLFGCRSRCISVSYTVNECILSTMFRNKRKYNTVCSGTCATKFSFWHCDIPPHLIHKKSFIEFIIFLVQFTYWLSWLSECLSSA